MDWYWLPPACGFLSIASVIWLLTRCSDAFDEEQERVDALTRR